MIQSVIKRDGRIVEYDAAKIATAIGKAFSSCGISDTALTDDIAKAASEHFDDNVNVEQIQDFVVQSLRDAGQTTVAEAYEAYRQERSIARQSETKRIFDDIINIKANDITRENANMNADTPSGMMMKFASESTKPFADAYLLSADVKKALHANLIHIHDKDFYVTKSLTCIQHPCNTILQHGFKAAHAESRPARRIETASVQACISLETAQNEMHGGQAIPAFDFYMAPYVRLTYIEEVKVIEAYDGEDYSELYNAEIDDYIKRPLKGLAGLDKVKQQAINRTVSRVHQAMEGFIHNMNTIHSRGGNQVVFSSINYGTDTSAEGRCIIHELLKTTYEGVGNGATAIFPIQIWKKKRGVNYLPEDRNYDLYKLACKVSAKRFFPNFLNLDATFNQHEDWRADDPERYLYEVATMGCRTRVFEDIHGQKTSVGRGNLSFTTINIVGLALSVRKIADKTERINAFMTKLSSMCDLVAKQLDERMQFQKTAYAKQFPLVMSSLWLGHEKLKPTDQVGDVLECGTLGIGFIGLAECLVALTGKHHAESEEAQQLGIQIVSRMVSKCQEYKTTYKHNYAVLATPAEGLSGKFTKVDKKMYGELPGITDKAYYTNSNHVPVWCKCTAKHKAEIEAPYHALTLGGHIFYVELDGDATHNPDAIMRIVDYMDKYNMGYASVNHNRNRCANCGHEDAVLGETVCPECGGTDIRTLARITGYLTGDVQSQWNEGKQCEHKDRVTHVTHITNTQFSDETC